MFLITGANAGIGLETAATLAGSPGATVMLAGRRPAAVAEAVAEVKARPGVDPGRVHAAPAPLDLADPASVTAFSAALASDLAAKGARLAVLVNNAGIAAPGDAGASAWPVEDDLMAVNAVGTHALTRLLLPLLLEEAAGGGGGGGAGPARVVTLSSRAHRSSPPLDVGAALAPPGAGAGAGAAPLSTVARYARSKLANALFAAELARRVNGGAAAAADATDADADAAAPPPRLLSIAVSPGFVRTKLASSFAASLLPGWLARGLTVALAQTPAKGARTSVFAATADAGAICGGNSRTGLPPGFCYAHAAKADAGGLSPQARDAGLAAELFEATERVIAAAGVELPPL